MILFNPVLFSVLIMCLLCLVKVNIMLAILIATFVAGLISGMPIIGDASIMHFLTTGMVGNAETALSYVLLGALAFGIQESGLANTAATKVEALFGKSAKGFLVALALLSCLSQNVIPIHIAFIPILIPSLLRMMNNMKIDRRAAACALTFGLKAPYIAIPAGFGLIFHTILADAMTSNGMPYNVKEIWKVNWLPALSMVVGLLIAIFVTYKRPKEYPEVEGMTDLASTEGEAKKFDRRQIGAALGALTAFVVQVPTGSMPLGALAGLIVMILTGAIPYKDMDKTVNGGIYLMGFIAFVMLVASGYGTVLRQTGGVESLIEAFVSVLGGSQAVGAFVMLLIGLIITMGIGTSFGTVPIIATIYVPLCRELGFSPAATLCLVAIAGALGDAGSPASDSTLGPTSGLNADGQHDHIWGTVVPTFIHYNIPLFIAGMIGALWIF